MFRARHPLEYGQQLGVLVPGGGRIPRLAGPAGELVLGHHGAIVFRATHPLEQGQQLGEQVLGGGRIPRC